MLESFATEVEQDCNTDVAFVTSSQSFGSAAFPQRGDFLVDVYSRDDVMDLSQIALFDDPANEAKESLDAKAVVDDTSRTRRSTEVTVVYCGCAVRRKAELNEETWTWGV